MLLYDVPERRITRWRSTMRATKLLSAALAAALTAPPAFAQDWPARSITVISPSAAGTTGELVARIVLDAAGQQLGHQVNIESHPGGDGTAGVAAVVHAAPDGYTFLLSSSAMTTALITHSSLPYDPVRDLAPVAMFGGQPTVLVVTAVRGIHSLADLVAAAKAQPGQLKFGSVGVGSAAHIAGERFRVAAGIDVKHVPYPGPVQALADLDSGQIDFYFLPIAPALPLVAQHKVVPLAVSTASRSFSLPGVPTFVQSGFQFPRYLIWSGLSAPRATPQDIIDKLNLAVGKALLVPAIRNELQRIDFDPDPMSPEQFGRFLADDAAAMTALGKEIHIDPVK
jgi:tripartite-type tricarboxylate transporter receptor subunit TctC